MFVRIFIVLIVCVCSMLMLESEQLQQHNQSNRQAESKKEQFDRSVYEWSKIMAEMFSLVKTKYYQDTSIDDAMAEALASFAQKLDPHSTFLDKKAYEGIKESIKGELCGIGVIIDNTKNKDDEFIRIVDTVPAGPADKAEIKPEDKIIEIDDEPVRGMNLEEAIRKIKGKKNTTVKIRIMRSDTVNHKLFTITRDFVPEPNALCFHFVEQNCYYLGLNMFTENSVKQVEDLVRKIQANHAKGLILDVRNNSGGLLTAVIDILGLFVPKGSLVVSTKGRDNQEQERYVTQKNPLLTDRTLPIFIMVNNYTASAAEIFAGCMQIYAQQNNWPIFVVGNKTFGKGSVQEVIPVSSDCAVKITTALYFLPNNTSIQGSGVTPDFIMDPKVPISQEAMWFNNTFGRESALKNAIKLDQEQTNPLIKKMEKCSPNNGKSKDDHEKSWYEKKQELIATDYLILSAIRLLTMFKMARAAHPGDFHSHKDTVRILNKYYAPNDKAEVMELCTDKQDLRKSF